MGDNVVELCARINHINGFYAKFAQKIIDSTGVILQENDGELWIKHPNLFHYHIISPEEYFLISNGKTLWFYDPYINQVTINWLDDILDDTFLMLLSNNSTDENWHKYYVNKDNDNFFLIPKENENAVFKKFIIKVTNQGIIKGFTIVNKDDQHIIYKLMQHDIRQFDKKKFNFILPENVAIDEQRLETN